MTRRSTWSKDDLWADRVIFPLTILLLSGATILLMKYEAPWETIGMAFFTCAEAGVWVWIRTEPLQNDSLEKK